MEEKNLLLNIYYLFTKLLNLLLNIIWGLPTRFDETILDMKLGKISVEIISVISYRK